MVKVEDLRGIKRLDKLVRAFEKAPVDEFFVKISNENKHWIEDENIKQLRTGKDADGKDIEPPYTLFTVRLKQAKGQEADFVTLEDTGKFYRGITAEINTKGFSMIGQDSKTGELMMKYGDRIIGISAQSIDNLKVDLYLPYLVEEIRIYLSMQDI
jgi:hypothetical protein